MNIENGKMMISGVNNFKIGFRAIAGLDISAKKPAIVSSPFVQDKFERTPKTDTSYEISAQDQIMGACGFLIPDITVELKDKINAKKLNEAIIEAMELHPLYKTQAKKNEKGLFYWAKNDKKPVIKQQNCDKDINFGTDKYNNFPWLVRYNGNKIVFNASHMLNDGLGALSFIKTFLRLYFEESGMKFENVSKWDIAKDLAHTTTEDGYLKYGKIKDKVCATEQKKNDASIIQKELLVDDENSIPTHRFFIDKEIIKKIAVKTDSSPAAVTSYLLAKALEKSINSDSGTINLPIPVNCRKDFPCNTDRNFIHIAPLTYDIASMKDLTLSDVSKIIKKQLKTSVDNRNMLSTFQELSNLTDAINANPKIIQKIKNDSIERNKTKTATICYSHITKTGFPQEFENLVQNVELASAVPLNGAAVCAFGLNYKDKIMLTVRHLFKDNIFVENLKKVLSQEKIDYSVKELPRSGTAKFQEP